jgi:thiol-disulfide isomerase/thioredoxin
MRPFVLLSLVSLSLFSADVASLLKRTRSHLQGIGRRYQMHMESDLDPQLFRPNPGPALKEIEADIAANPGGDSMEVLLVSKLIFSRMLNPLPADLNALALQVRNQVPGRSPAWGLDPALFLIVATPPMQDEAIRLNPDSALRAKVLATRAIEASRAGRLEEAKTLVARLEQELPKERDTAQARATLDAWLTTAPGSPAAPFKFANLEDRGVSFTLDSFKGKYLLIDFWATWCGPCRHEMPKLHQAWAVYKDRPFEILSLSFDKAAADVTRFRQQAGTPMPWKHAFVPSGFDNAVAEAYGVKSIPKPVLVGPDGRILLSGDGLRGEGLLPALKKYLPQ